MIAPRLPGLGRTVALAAMLAALSPVMHAAAQDSAPSRETMPPGGQIPQPSDQTVTMPQVAAPDSTVPPRPSSDVPADVAGASTQVNPETRRLVPGTQLSSEERTVQGSAPLSQRSEGRDTRLVRLGGEDRCDPASAGTVPVCNRVIERRAGEFARQPLKLSPEQRLLAERQARDPAGGIERAVQRIGRNEMNSTSQDDQQVASIVLGQQEPQSAPPVEEAPAFPTGAGELIEAIITGVTATAPR